MKITKEYIINTHYNGIHPTCKCGCGTLLSFKPLKAGPWFSEYTKNHAPKKKHTDQTKQKIKDSCKKSSISKYGVENPFQSEEIKNKIKQTNLKKYGVENYAQTVEWSNYAKTLRHSEKTKHKIKETNQHRYGANSFTASENGKILNRKNIIQRYYGSWEAYINSLQNLNVTCLTSEPDFYTTARIQFKCILCNNDWIELGTIRPSCDICQLKMSRTGRSKLETSVFAWLSTLNIPFTTNKIFKNLHNKKYSLDAYFPEYNLGIEINGLWWHSEVHGQKNKSYHVQKLDFFVDKQIRIINIFEDEWNNKSHIIKSKILHVLHKSTATKIPARKCVIKQLTGASCRDFIEQYHVQGFSPATVYLGAFYNDKLIGCMTFSSIGRFNKHALPSTYELIRYVTNNTIISTGLASKLLQYFIINFNPSKIISYADRRFTIKDQNVYTKLGFTLIDVTPPNYFYIKGSRRYHRLKFQKHKLSNILPTFDSAMTEWENMKLNKYDRIWDCGHLKYELIVK